MRQVEELSDRPLGRAGEIEQVTGYPPPEKYEGVTVIGWPNKPLVPLEPAKLNLMVPVRT